MMDPNEVPTMRSRARLGDVLREKWRLDELLGVGGMATVYGATHCNNGKRVAIKVLHQELSVVPEMRNRFLREGYVANKVAHSGIVSILDDDVAEDGSVFLVMELLDGLTVEALREQSGNFLPVNQVAHIGDQLLDVLAAAHEAGIVHRDIKPENLFLTRDGELKVLDFGIARLRELQGAKITITGAPTMGTPAFMPPEQARGRSELVSARSDIWAVGATMFTLASGRLVHDADTVNELLLAAMTRNAPPMATVLPNFPAAIGQVIDRALAYEQNARWPDVRAMQAALRSAAASIGLVLQERLVLPALPPRMPLGVAASPTPGGARLAPTEDDVEGSASARSNGAMPHSAAVQGARSPRLKGGPLMATAAAMTMGSASNGLFPTPRGLSSKWIAIAAGLVLLLSAGGVWFSLRGRHSATPVLPPAPSFSVTVAPSARPSASAVIVEPVASVEPGTVKVVEPPPVEPTSATPASASASSGKPNTKPPKKTGTAPPPPSTSDPGPKRKPDSNILDKQF